MRSKLFIAAIALLSVVVASQAAFDWSAYWYFYESDGSTWLANNASENVGSFVQLIWDVDEDGVDAPIAGGTGIAAGSDDVVYDVSWFGENGGPQGAFFDGATPELVGAGATEDQNVYYARVWSDPAAVWNGTSSEITPTATYWDGLEFTYTDGIPQTYNMTGSAGSPYNSNITVDGVPNAIPEPTVVALGFMGILLLRVFRKRS